MFLVCREGCVIIGVVVFNVVVLCFG